MNQPLDVGSALPAMTVASSDQRIQTLADLTGQWTVLFFYPKDMTPGCTVECEGFRDLRAEFEAQGVQLVGASRDPMSRHEKFIEKYQLNFPLIADPTMELCEAFGVMKDKTMFGKPVRGIERSTFLIDPNGVIQKAWRKVKVPGHVDAVLAAVSELETA